MPAHWVLVTPPDYLAVILKALTPENLQADRQVENPTAYSLPLLWITVLPHCDPQSRSASGGLSS